MGVLARVIGASGAVAAPPVALESLAGAVGGGRAVS